MRLVLPAPPDPGGTQGLAATPHPRKAEPHSQEGRRVPQPPPTLPARSPATRDRLPEPHTASTRAQARARHQRSPPRPPAQGRRGVQRQQGGGPWRGRAPQDARPDRQDQTLARRPGRAEPSLRRGRVSRASSRWTRVRCTPGPSLGRGTSQTRAAPAGTLRAAPGPVGDAVPDAEAEGARRCPPRPAVPRD